MLWMPRTGRWPGDTLWNSVDRILAVSSDNARDESAPASVMEQLSRLPPLKRFDGIHKLIQSRIQMPLDPALAGQLLALSFVERFPGILTGEEMLQLATLEFMERQGTNPLSLADAVAKTNQDRSAIRKHLHEAVHAATPCCFAISRSDETERSSSPLIAAALTAPIVLGRQEADEPPPPVRIQGEFYDRVVCTDIAERQMSRRQLRIEYARPDELAISNLGKGRVLVDQHRLRTGESMVTPLNIEIELRHIRVRLFRTQPGAQYDTALNH